MIDIKALEKGKTPTLSRCVQHFNDINAMVKCLTLMAKHLGQPVESKVQINGVESATEETPSEQNNLNPGSICYFCGRPREALIIQQHLANEKRPRLPSKSAHSRGVSIKKYLCMPTITYSLSMRVRRCNYLLDSTLQHLCDLAEVNFIYLLLLWELLI